MTYRNQTELQVQNSLNYDYREWQGTVNTLPSQTIPDQTMSLKEIIERHTRGLPTLGKEPIYHGEDIEIPNFATMDLAEQQEMREDLDLYIAEQKDKLRQMDADRKTRLAEEAEKKKKSQWQDFLNYQKSLKNNDNDNQTAGL